MPSPTLVDQRAVRNSLALTGSPPHSPRPSPDGRARGSQVPGEGALGRRTGQLRGDSPPRCQPRRVQAQEGRGRGRLACPPAAGLSWASALRPRVPKLLNLRAAHALRGQRPTRRIGPRGGPVRPSLPAMPPRPRSAPRSPPAARALRRASDRPELSARRGAGPPLARGRESPPLQSHPRAGPPSRDPQQKTDWSARPGSP